MISEVSPDGYVFLFFSLFSLVGKTSAFIGPFVSSAIENDSGNASMPFAFLLALTVVSSFGLFWVDIRKGRVQQERFLKQGNRRKGFDPAAVKDVTEKGAEEAGEKQASA